MGKQLKCSNYTLYTFEEFLQDDYFIESMKKPTEESISFWKVYEDQNPLNIDNFISAKQYLEIITADVDYLPGDRVSKLWDQINTQNNKRKKGRILFELLKVAACIGIIAALFPIIKYIAGSDTDVSDIAYFAKTNLHDVANSTETQLVLSDNNVISLTEKESVITYKNDEIEADEKIVQKKEAASYNQIITPKGKRSVLTFSDGSKVWINAGSRVVYPSEFQKEKREIYVDGEIFIEVAKDEARPFFVKTKEMNIKVLGTTFNVSAYESDVIQSVVLVSGSVEIESDKISKTVLKPSQMFHLAGEKGRTETVDTHKYTSWVQGLYYFDSENLSTVLSRLSTYYGVDIKCNEIIANIKCSGHLDLKEEFDNVLSDLSFVASISYTKTGENGYVVIKRQQN